MRGGIEPKSAGGLSYRRYRRRILGWGAAVLLFVFAVGAAITLGRVEDDLAERVVAVLDEEGIAGVRVSFSGQEGTLDCTEPLGEPTVTQQRAAAVRGVRSIDLEASCLGAGGVAAGADSDRAAAVSGGGPVTTTGTTVVEDGSAADGSSPASTGVGQSVFDVLAGDPQFSSVVNAAEAAGLFDLVDDAEPFTAFVPSNAAFDALSPEAAGALNADPTLLDEVLTNHVTFGIHPLDELTTGPLEMAGGSTVLVDADASPPTLTSGSTVAAITDGDIAIAEGLVHVVDRLLVPPGLDLGSVVGEATMTATYEGGALILDGAVGTETDHVALVDAASAVLADANVIDQIEIDADVAPDAALATAAELLPLATTHLASGVVAVVDGTVEVTGEVVDATSRAELVDAARQLGVSTTLRPRPTIGTGPLQGAPGAAAIVDLRARLDTILGESPPPLRFAAGSFDVADADDAALDRVAAAIKGTGGTLIEVAGHTTASGDPNGDFLLSYARSTAVIEELVARGVPEDQLEVRADGATDPVRRGGTIDGPASRRVTFTVRPA